MSGHADTIRVLRYVVASLRTRGEPGLADTLEQATSQLVAENREQAETIATLANASQRWQETAQRQADRIAWLEGDVAGWRIKLAECEERQER